MLKQIPFDLNYILIAASSITLGLTMAFIVWWIARQKTAPLQTMLMGRPNFKSYIQKHLAKIKFNEKKGQKEGGENAYYLIGSMIGALTGATISSFSPLGILWGSVLGAVVGRGTHYVISKKKNHQITREVAILYETVDMYLQEKYTLYDALMLSSMLVPKIRPVISKCLMNWSTGPVEALKKIGDDIGTDAAKMLSTMLIQIAQEGYEGIKGVMATEGNQIDELRASLAESELQIKPIYQAVFLVLPGLGFLGIVLLPWAYKLVLMITSLNAGGNGGVINAPTIPFLNF